MPFVGGFEFPHSDYYDGDLRELVRLYKELEQTYDNLQKEIQETIDFVNNFEEHADELIDERVNVVMATYQQRLIAVENLVKALEEEINKDDGLTGQIEEIRLGLEQLQNQVFRLKMQYEDRFQELMELMHEYKHSMDTYVDEKANELQQFIIDHVTSLDRLDVINPITGVYEDIQNVLNEMVDILVRSYGLTAEQYDNLKLTARVYDGYRITAYDYSTRGYFELYLKLTQNLMVSPFTGKNDTYENVIYSLANLHKCALTAAEYDARQITAENYEKMELTAFMFDWFGFKVMNFITAALYDSLKLTAQEYDEKLVTAAQYEQGMKWLVDMTMRCNSTCNNIWILANQIQELTHQVEEYKEVVDNFPRAMTTGSGISYVGRVRNNLTAYAYDSYELQAAQYDAYQITAEQYESGIRYIDPQVSVDGMILIRTSVPELQDDSIVIVNSEQSDVIPIKIVRFGKTVEVYWPDTVRDMMYSVTVQNKKEVAM